MAHPEAEDGPATPAFATTVFPRELDDIQRLRALAGQPPVPVEPGQAPRPNAALGLTAIALSGGGIRSAAFSLGVIQALAARGILARTDYLSTVSGGGYLGAALSHLLNGRDPTHSAAPESFPLRMGSGSAEPSALRHLRNSSNYLRSAAMFPTLAMPAVYLRGLLLTAAFWLPALLATVFCTAILYEVILPVLQVRGIYDSTGPSMVPSIVAGIGLLGLIAAYPFLRRPETPLKHREQLERVIRVMLGVTLTSVLILPFWYLVDQAVSHTQAQMNAIAAARRVAVMAWVAREEVPLAITAGILAAVVAMAARSPVGRKIGRGLALAALGLLSPALMFGLFIHLCLTEIGSHTVIPDGSALVAELPQGEATIPLPDELGRFLVENRTLASADDLLVTRQPHDAGIAAGTTVWWIHPADGEGSGNWVVSLVLQNGRLHIRDPGAFLGTGGGLLAAAVVLGMLINARFLNVNQISPHGYYRDRLSRVFLGEALGVGGGGDAVKLSELGGGDHPDGAHAPYHLINATLNLAGSNDPNLRGRQGDFLLLSKHFVGSDHTGWCDTKQVERRDPALNLGTAMAVSGGVANPVMGSLTTPAITGLMTLLNLRMGYWLPNPKRILEGSGDRTFTPAPGPGYLRREALRQLDAESAYVNASDGGHIENLGIYELLRRRCALIIAVDGEEDPELAMVSLSTAIRYARIDLGVEIEMDLTGLRNRDGGPSEHHYATGRIRYSATEEGKLVYLKATLSGDENVTIRTYASMNPTFPHQSTADQFFNEEQFEAYRALGEHVASNVSW